MPRTNVLEGKVNKEILEKLYWGQRLSLPQIAKLYGVTLRAIAMHMRKCGIATRSISEAKKGSIPWNKGLTVTNDPRMAEVGRKISQSIAQRPPRKPSRYWLGKHHSEETRKKLSIIESGESNPFFGKRHNETTKRKLSKKAKERWLDPEFITCYMQARHIKPNKTELAFDAWLQEVLPGEYKYVGDGQFILGGRCPDWLNINGQKKLVELFGDYWHRGENPQDKIDHYKRYGFDTLVIWENELKDKAKLLQIINDFNNKEVYHGRR